MNVETWEQGCLDATDVVFYERVTKGVGHFPTPSEAIKALRAELDHYSPSTADVDYAAMAAAATRHAAKVNCDEDNFTCLTRIEGMLAAKQHDYGHGNILKFGLLGVVVRLSDKLARLENLYKRMSQDDREYEPTFCESIADTWDDIVGYCVIALMVLDGTFELPLRDDLVEQQMRDAHDLPDLDCAKATPSSVPAGEAFILTNRREVYRLSDSHGEWEYMGEGFVAWNAS